MRILPKSMLLVMVIASTCAVANECSDAKDVPSAIRISIARVAVPLMCQELDKRNILKMRIGPPDKDSHILMTAGRLVQEIEKLKEKFYSAADIAYVDAWRAFLVTLGKWDEYGGSATAANLCYAGISLRRRDYAEPERSLEGGLEKTLWYNKTPDIAPAILLVIEREYNLIRSKSGPSDIDDDSLGDVEKAIQGSRLVDVFPYSGKIKEVRTDEGSPDTWVKLWPVALTPRNVFGSPGSRQVLFDLLEEFIARAEDKRGKKIFANRTAQSLAQLRRWYRFQDGLVNISDSIEQLRSNIERLKDVGFRAELDALRKDSEGSHFFLTGCIFGPLLTGDDLVNLLEEVIETKKVMAPQLFYYRGRAFGDFCSTPSSSGIMLCSMGIVSVEFTTKAVKKALSGKSAKDVKAFFGRKPDDVQGGIMWVYRGDFYDEAAEISYPQARVVMIDERVVDVLFSKEQVR